MALDEANEDVRLFNISIISVGLIVSQLCFTLNIFQVNLFNQSQFIVDEVSAIIKDVIEEAIGGNAYQQSKVNQWTTNVVESCLGNLTKLQKPFKYIGKYIK